MKILANKELIGLLELNPQSSTNALTAHPVYIHFKRSVVEYLKQYLHLLTSSRTVNIES